MRLIFCLGLVASAAIIPSPDEPLPLDEPPLATFSLDEFNNPPPPTPIEHNTEANVTANVEEEEEPEQEQDEQLSRKRVRLHSPNLMDREAELLTKKCNDQHLAKIMRASMTPSLSTSKMIISERASRDYGTVFDVICARSHFSYYVEASNYCEVTLNGITCFAYRSSASSRVAKRLHASPPMCHCPSGQVGYQCPNPIQLNCPPAAPCPSPTPCNMFGNLPTLPTLPPHNFQTLAPFTLAPVGGQTYATLPPAIPPPGNGQETLLGINQQVAPSAQYAEVPPQAQAPAQPVTQAPVFVQDAVTTTFRPATLPSETYVELENPEAAAPNARPPPVLQNVVDHVYESEPNHGYRQPVRRQAPPLNEKCNDDRLRRIIEENVDDNPSTSKRKIQKAAADEIGGLFDVICSAHDFSYLANTQLFCESGNDDVTCFAFLHSLIQ